MSSLERRRHSFVKFGKSLLDGYLYQTYPGCQCDTPGACAAVAKWLYAEDLVTSVIDIEIEIDYLGGGVRVRVPSAVPMMCMTAI